MRKNNLLATIGIASVILFGGCQKDGTSTATSSDGSRLKATSAITVPLGSAAGFSILAGTTVTNAGPSLITTNLGVSPGTAITGFQPIPLNTIAGPGTVTPGLGIVNGTIYAGGPVAALAHNDAVVAYNYLTSLVPDTTYAGVSQLDGLTFTPGVYKFASSANLQVNGTLYLDFQGNANAQFVFQMGTTLVTMAGSKVVAINNNNQTCNSSNVFWAVGSSATINGAQFMGTVIATTTITMTSGSNVAGRILALNGAVTLLTDTISTCSSGSGSGGTDSVPTTSCRDYVTDGGWINGPLYNNTHKGDRDQMATFGISAGIKSYKFWGQLSYNDHLRNGTSVKSTSITAYIIIDSVTRQIEGTAKINGCGSFTFKVIVVDNGKTGHNDSFSLELSNGYTVSGTLKGGNIQLRNSCDEPPCKDKDKENCNDKDEQAGNNNCNKGFF